VEKHGQSGVAAALATGLLVMIAACGTESDAGSTEDTGGSPQVHTVVNVDITGDAAVKGSSKAPMPTNNGVDYRSCDQTLTDTGSPPGVSVGGTLYYTQSGTTSTVTTDGKGGGSWVFTGLSVKNPDGTEGGGPEVSGSVTWTCED